jgi:eyes absent family protein 2
LGGVSVLQIENYNQPFLDVLSKYDDGRDLSDYDFNQDELGPPHDDANKRKIAYRHRIISQKYLQVKFLQHITNDRFSMPLL